MLPCTEFLPGPRLHRAAASSFPFPGPGAFRGPSPYARVTGRSPERTRYGGHVGNQVRWAILFVGLGLTGCAKHVDARVAGRRRGHRRRRGAPRRAPSPRAGKMTWTARNSATSPRRPAPRRSSSVASWTGTRIATTCHRAAQAPGSSARARVTAVRGVRAADLEDASGSPRHETLNPCVPSGSMPMMGAT